MSSSTFSRLLLSSPTAIISTTSRGKYLQAASGAASVSPALMFSADLLDGLGQHAVAGRVLGDAQRLQDRDAVVQQRARGCA